MKKLKEFCQFFGIQLTLYLLLVINYRAVASANYAGAVASDGTFATIQFFVVRKIAKEATSLHQWAGYVAGSMAGSLIGIWLSKILLRG